MADEESGIYGRLLEVHAKLGKHDAQIAGLSTGARDTNDSILRLGDRFETQNRALRAELKHDIEKVGETVKTDIAALLKEIREATETHEKERRSLIDAAITAKEGTIEATIAKHWRIALIGVVILSAATFGAGLQSGRTGVMPLALDVMKGMN